MDKIYETDLYLPVFEYLTEQGYTVRSEVKNCDLAAIKGDELIIIELKRSFNATLLMQAVERQKAADSVYVAIPRPKGGSTSRDWDGMCLLLRRLELGLIQVDFRSTKPFAEVVLHPSSYSPTKSKKIRYSILREAGGRYGDYNTGGSKGRKLVTVYRENAVHIACCFERFGPLAPRQLRKLGTGKKTLSILSKNFYGWFEKIGRGKYDLHETCRKFTDNYPELAAHYRREIEKVVENNPELLSP